MRQIDDIIVHCTATAEGREASVQEIDRWHRARGWKCIGYHWVVGLDGTVHKGRAETDAGAHCKGHNAHSIGVCYVGGLASDGKTPKDTRTAAQRTALRKLVKELQARYPNATLHGHRDYAAKACPCFDVHKDL